MYFVLFEKSFKVMKDGVNLFSISIFLLELSVFLWISNKEVITSTQGNSIAASLKVRHISLKLTNKTDHLKLCMWIQNMHQIIERSWFMVAIVTDLCPDLLTSKTKLLFSLRCKTFSGWYWFSTVPLTEPIWNWSEPTAIAVGLRGRYHYLICILYEKTNNSRTESISKKGSRHPSKSLTTFQTKQSSF